MPRKAATSRGRASGSRGAKRAAPRSRTAQPTEASVDAERHIDACDVDFTAGELTLDSELPPATGGVEVVRQARRGVTRRK
jgi:hypothetical protein